MRKSLLVTIFVLFSFLFFSNVFSGSTADSGMFDTEEDKKRWEKIMVELKKISIRTKKLETQNLANIQENQAELLQQIDQLQTLIPGVQGAIEATKSEMGNNFQSFQNESQIQCENLIKGMAQFKDSMVADLAQLKEGVLEKEVEMSDSLKKIEIHLERIDERLTVF